MILVNTARWNCTPVMAEVQIVAESWKVSPPVLTQDLAPDSQLYKVILVTSLDGAELVYIQCTANNRGETCLEFMLSDALADGNQVHARDLIERVIRRGWDEGLVGRPLGFRR